MNIEIQSVTNPNYRKKKQPQLVRANLLEATAQVVIERGLAGMTLDLVAQKAGVSKGGLLHHFANKHVLIESLCMQLLEDFEEAIHSFIENDPEPRGRFFRAYLKATVAPIKSPYNTRLFGAFALEMSHDDEIATMWQRWFQTQAEKYEVELHCPIGNMIRYAADGIWMEKCIGVFVNSSKDRQAVVDYLVKISYDI